MKEKAKYLEAARRQVDRSEAVVKKNNEKVRKAADGGSGKGGLNEGRVKERSREGSGKREVIEEKERNEEGMKGSGHEGMKERKIMDG